MMITPGDGSATGVVHVDSMEYALGERFFVPYYVNTITVRTI